MPPPPSQRSSGSSKKSSGPGGGSLSAPARADVGGRGNSGGYKQSTSSGPQTRAPRTSGSDADKRNQQSAAVKDARQVAKERSLSEDARRGGIRSIEVGPQRQTVQIGTGKISQTVNTANADSFYANDPVYQQALQKMRSERELSRAPVAAKDAVRYAREAPAYNFMTDAEKQAIREKYGSGPIEGIGKLASYAYNNPGEIARNAAAAVISPFVTGGQYLMGAKPALDRYGNITPQAAEDLTGVAVQTGITGGIASLAYPRPANSIGMGILVGPGSFDPAIRRVFSAGESAIKKGATEADAFYESLKKAPSYSSGMQYVPSERIPGRGFMTTPAVEIAEPFELRPDVLRPGFNIRGQGPISTSWSPWSSTFKPDVLERSYPDLANVPTRSNPYALKQGIGGIYSNPAQGKPYGLMEINVPVRSSLAERTLPSKINPGITKGKYDYQTRSVPAHEASHFVAAQEYMARARAQGNVPPVTGEVLPFGSSPSAMNWDIRQAEGKILKTDPSYNLMSPSDLNYLGEKMYENRPGEVIARLAQEQRFRVPESKLKNFETRYMSSLPRSEIGDFETYSEDPLYYLRTLRP
jgi:hypothetical protein